METSKIIELIANSPKKTIGTVYITTKDEIIKSSEGYNLYKNNDNYVLKGDFEKIKADIENLEIEQIDVDLIARNSAVPLIDYSNINARIEPGVVIRDMVEIKDNAVIMMGASINIGAVIGERTMIDMNVVVGGRAIIGSDCHIGAGTVVAGVIEPPSAQPVEIGNNVVVGANAVILEGIKIAEGAIVGAGAIVTQDVPSNAVVVGAPAKIIKYRDEKTNSKTEIVDALRRLNND
jgi:tetrahydrodipicolinate N-acetyltransferase